MLPKLRSLCCWAWTIGCVLAIPALAQTNTPTPTFTPTPTPTFTPTATPLPPRTTQISGLPATTVVSNDYFIIDKDVSGVRRTRRVGSTDVLSYIIANYLGVDINDEELAAEDYGDFTCDGNEDGCLIDPDAVALGTDTTGNYVEGIDCGAGITGCVADSEGSDPVLASTLGEDINDEELAAEDFGDFTCDGNEDGCLIDNSTITSAKIVNGTVTGDDVNDGSLGEVDLLISNSATAAFCLVSDGATGFTWSTCNTGPVAPGGSNTEVQYNDGGVLEGDAGLTYNAATDTLTAGTVIGANVTSGADPGHTHTGGSASTDIISEGNSNIEVIDTGTGQVDIDIDGARQFKVTVADGFSANNATGPAILNAGTGPVLIPDRTSPTTGVGGGSAAGELSLSVAGETLVHLDTAPLIVVEVGTANDSADSALVLRDRTTLQLKELTGNGGSALMFRPPEAITSPVICDLLDNARFIPNGCVEVMEDGDVSDAITVSAGVLNLENSTMTGVADDEVPVGSAANAITYVAVPDCDAGRLLYDTATNTFSCGTINALVDSDSTVTVVDASGEGIANARVEFKPNGSTLATKTWISKYDPFSFPDADDSEVYCYETFSDGTDDDCTWVDGNVGGGDTQGFNDYIDTNFVTVDDDGSGTGDLTVWWTAVPGSGDWYAEMRFGFLFQSSATLAVEANDWCGLAVLMEGTTGSPSEMQLFGYFGDATAPTGWDIGTAQKDDYTDAPVTTLACDASGGCVRLHETFHLGFGVHFTDSTDTYRFQLITPPGYRYQASAVTFASTPVAVGYGCMAQNGTADININLHQFAVVTGSRATNRAIGN